MEGKYDSMDVSQLSVSNHVLLSGTSQVVIPCASKSNIPNFLDIFYYRCIMHGLPLNLPYILLSHMKMALIKKKVELPYGVVPTIIAKRRNVNMNMYTI